jgi:hypothetical protein
MFVGIMAIAGAIFLFVAPRFIDSLLSVEEQGENERISADGESALRSLGLSRLFSIASLGISFVLAVHVIFLHGGPMSVAIGLVTACLGFLLLWHGKQHARERKPESVS